jgi:hypothetical protein
VLSADANITSSTIPPADPTNGTLWYDTNSGRLFVYLNSSWVDSSPLIATSIPLASTSTVGGVKIGSGLTVTQDGTISALAPTINVTTATDVDLGLVKIGTGLSVTDTGTVSLNIATYDNIGGVKIGSGLLIDEQGVLFASTYSGNVLNPYLTVNVSYLSSTGGLQIYRGSGNANAGIVWSNNDIISNGITTTTGSFRLVVGDRVEYSTLAVDNIRISTATNELNIFGNNNPTSVISVRGTTNYQNQVTQDYHIPNKRYVDNKFATTATTATVGVVKIGTGISISSDGTISATTATPYTLPTASTSVLGGVKVDGTSTIIVNGVISAVIPSVVTATNSVLGLVKIGSGINVTSDGTISVSTASSTATSFTGGSVISSTQFLSNTPSTSTTTGAVTIVGGLGVQGSVNVGNTVTAMSFISNTTGVPEVYSASNLNLVAVGRVQVTQSPFKVWNVTTGQRNSIPAANGDLIYNTDTNKFQGYANGTWVDLN